EIEGHVWVDCNGRRLGRLDPNAERVQKATAASRVRHRTAQMNHYITRTEENFALKRGTPSASAGRDRYTDEFFEKFNRNERVDETALRFADRFDALFAEAMDLPGVRRLHHLCCADYVVRLAEKQGMSPDDDPRWHHHMAQANA
ncbi:MAG: glycosyltransferase family 2 protein, partial [Pseudomonadota bacterium]